MKNAVKWRKNHFVNRCYYTILAHGCKARSIQEFAVFHLENCVFFYGNAFVRIEIGKNFQFNITHVFLLSAHTASGQKSGRARNRDDGTQIVLHFCQVCHRSRSGLTRKKVGRNSHLFYMPEGAGDCICALLWAQHPVACQNQPRFFHKSMSIHKLLVSRKCAIMYLSLTQIEESYYDSQCSEN